MQKTRRNSKSRRRPAAPAPVRIGIAGTGGMAGLHMQLFSKVRSCRVVAACDLDPVRLDAFCDRHGIEHRYSGIDSMLRDAGPDAVSIVASDAAHAPLAIACLDAGVPVLCEKPLALDYPEARRMMAAAHRAQVANMVNFSYRNWSCIHGAAAAVAKGQIGELRHIEASYLQSWLVSDAWGDWRTKPAFLWRLSRRHGSKGVLGDVGVHILDFATMPCGPLREVQCKLKTFRKAPRNRIGPYVFDANDSAVVTAEFASGALGVIHTSRWVGGHNNRLALKLSGTEGTLDIDSDRSTTAYRICRGRDLKTSTWVEVDCKPVPSIHANFVKAVRSGTQAAPGFDRGAEIQKVLDACFRSDQEGRAVRV